MKFFRISLLFFLTILGPFQAFGSLTCSDPGYFSGAGYTCSYKYNYIEADYFENFPLNTRALTMVADLYTVRRIGNGCGNGSGYPYSLFLLTVEDSQGVARDIVELEHTSATQFSYKAKGTAYYTKTVAGGVFLEDDYYFVLKFSVDMTTGNVNMATTYGRSAHIDAPVTTVSFPTNWAFDASMRIWLGGRPSSTSRYEMYIEEISTWNGYLPYPSIYTGALLLGHFAKKMGDYFLRDYEGYLLGDSFGDIGTAYLGSSTSTSPDTVNSPAWMEQRGILQFTSATKFISIPAFTVGSPNEITPRSLSLSFWVKITTAPSSNNYIFRYSDSALTIDRFSLKHDSALNLQVCAGGICQTPFTGLSSDTWAHLSVNWALRTKNSSNYQGYYSLYKNGELLKFEGIDNVPISAATISLTDDKVRFGGFIGQLALISLYSPGSLQLNKPTWCASSSCSADLGASSVPNCLMMSSCNPSCNGCTDGATQGCLACASGKYYYGGECVECPERTFISGDHCQPCSENCISCGNATSCSTCDEGYKVTEGGACVKEAVVCPANCETCDGTGTCLSCKANYLKFNDVCVSKCPTGSYQSGANCLHCSDDCDVCTDGTTCTKCQSGLYLHEGVCVDTCPPGSYQSGTNCLHCSENCDVCTNGNTCTKCQSSHYIHEGECVNACPVTTYQSGGSCFACSNHCDFCIDGNTCTKCTAGFYYYQQACYEKCPPSAPYRSSTLGNTFCYETCPKETPYISNNICYETCPPETPSLSQNICSPVEPEMPETPESPEEGSDTSKSSTAKLNNAVESTANTLLISRNIFSISATSPLMFGSITKLLRYTRHMDISHSEGLEAVFQAEKDAENYIPMPRVSESKLDSSKDFDNVPYVFEKYEVSASFLLNQGNNLLRILTIFGLTIVVLLLQKAILYRGNMPLTHSAVLKTRFFFQNYLLSQFYMIVGDIAFCTVLELKAVAFSDSFSLVSFLACLSCMILAGALFVANIWIVKKCQSQKKIFCQDEEKLQQGALENFCKEYKGICLLFNDFEEASFTHQALLVFFVGRNILFCLIIALFYKSPIVQCVLLLVINLAFISYYLWKKSIKCRMDFVEQVIYELILLSVSACFLIMAVADRSGSASGVTQTLSGVILVLDVACKFLALAFLIIRFALFVWQYRQIIKRRLEIIMNKKINFATVAPFSLKKTVDYRRPPTFNSEKPLDTSQSISMNSEKPLDTSQSISIDPTVITEQNLDAASLNASDLDIVRRYKLSGPLPLPERSLSLDQSSASIQPETSPNKLYAPTESQLFEDKPHEHDEESEDKCYAPKYDEVFEGMSEAMRQELGCPAEKSPVSKQMKRRGVVKVKDKKRPIF